MIRALRNQDNNCCYNVLLQTFMHTPGLRNALEHIWRQLSPSDPEMGPMRARLIRLLERLGDERSGDPRTHLLIPQLLSKAQNLEYGLQHDVLELYEKFIDQIEREVQGKETIIELPGNYHRLIDREYRSWEATWRAHATKTTLSAAVFGYQIDQYRCQHCKRRLHSKQLFNSIRLPLVQKDGEITSLKTLLDVYLQEKLQDDLRTCDSCRQPRQMSLITRYYRAPDVLALAIQRTSGYSTEKNQAAVGIPDTLDFSPALVQPVGPKLYHLNTVILHHGRYINYGHYTALVRVGGSWYMVDDDHIRPYNPEVDRLTVERNAYMAFYSAV